MMGSTSHGKSFDLARSCDGSRDWLGELQEMAKTVKMMILPMTVIYMPVSQSLLHQQQQRRTVSLREWRGGEIRSELRRCGGRCCRCCCRRHGHCISTCPRPSQEASSWICSRHVTTRCAQPQTQRARTLHCSTRVAVAVPKDVSRSSTCPSFNIKLEFCTWRRSTCPKRTAPLAAGELRR